MIGFLVEILDANRPMMAECDYRALETKLNAVMAKQQTMLTEDRGQKKCFDIWSTMLQHNKERATKAYVIVSLLTEKRDKFKNSEQKFDRQAISILNAFLSLFQRFIEYPEPFGIEENTFLAFIDKLTSFLRPAPLHIIHVELENIKITGKTTHDSFEE